MIWIDVWLPKAKLSSDETSNLRLLNYKVSFIPLFEFYHGFNFYKTSDWSKSSFEMSVKIK